MYIFYDKLVFILTDKRSNIIYIKDKIINPMLIIIKFIIFKYINVQLC